MNNVIYKKYLFLVLILFGVFFFAKISWAKDYYVNSNSGNSSPVCINSPGPDMAACKTIMYVVNNAVLAGGDTVYIQAGIYDEAVTVTASDQGYDGNYVIFKSYQNDDVTIAPSNGYTPLSIWNNWDGGVNTTRYIKWDGGGSDNGRHITFVAGTAWRVIILRNVQYIWLNGLKIDGSNHADYNIYMLSYNLGTDSSETDDNKGPKNCILENLESFGAMSYGLKLTGWGTDNNIIRNSSFHDNAIYGISISGNGYNNNPPADNEIYNNEIYANANNGLQSVSTGGGGHNGNKLYENIIRNNGSCGIGLGTDADKNEVYFNIIYNNSYYGIGFYKAHSNLVYNNVIYNNTAAWDGNVIFQGDATNTSANNEFYNNSIYENGNNYGIYVKSSSNGNIIKNNIVYTSGSGSHGLYAFRADTTDLTVQNNSFKNSAYNKSIYYGGTEHTMAEMNSQAWALNNIDENPNWDTDYRLTSATLSGSGHVRDGGQDLSFKFTIDRDGINRPQGSAWDIGAYEYVRAADTTSPSAPSGVTII